MALRSVKYMQSKFLHLIDNTSVHGALVKGRTSSRRLKYVIKESQSYVLAGNWHPLFGYTRSHTNPADHPRRRFPLRSTGARGNCWLQKDLWQSAGVQRPSELPLANQLTNSVTGCCLHKPRSDMT